MSGISFSLGSILTFGPGATETSLDRLMNESWPNWQLYRKTSGHRFRRTAIPLRFRCPRQFMFLMCGRMRPWMTNLSAALFHYVLCPQRIRLPGTQDSVWLKEITTVYGNYFLWCAVRVEWVLVLDSTASHYAYSQCISSNNSTNDHELCGLCHCIAWTMEAEKKTGAPEEFAFPLARCLGGLC